MENAPQAEHIRFLFDPIATLNALAAQRRRFGSTVESLSTEELASPSRCAGWTVSDVLRHLVWVDVTVRRIWSGDESLAPGFDPRITPNDAVLADRTVSDEVIRDRYLLSTETMTADLESSDLERFGQPSLSPAGRVPWWMSAVHIGWDSSIHERDALIPLGRTVGVMDAEMGPCLAYSLVMTSFFAGRDPLSVRVGNIQLHREAGPVTVQAVMTDSGESDVISNLTTMRVTGDLVDVIDAIAGRGSIDGSLEGDVAVAHRLTGLARYFTSVS